MDRSNQCSVMYTSGSRCRSDWISQKLAVMKIILHIIFLAIGGSIAARPRRSPNGERILIEQAPYYISIRRNGQHICGGVLMISDTVLTGPLCLTSNNTTAVSGADEKNPNGTVHQFVPIETDDEIIAVAKLHRPIVPNNKQDSIHVPLMAPSYNEKAELISFKPENGQLRRFEVTLAPFHECSLNHDMLCGLRGPGSTLEPGEIGGPLVQNGRLIGIALQRSQQQNDYDVYLDFYKHWESFKNDDPRLRSMGHV